MIFAFILSALRLLGLLPRPWAFRVGRAFGYIMLRADKKHRQIVYRNLSRAFGNEKNAEDVRRLSRGVFENLGLLLF